MDSLVINQLKARLRRYQERMPSLVLAAFHANLQHFWKHIHENQRLNECLQSLRPVNKDVTALIAERIERDPGDPDDTNPENPLLGLEDERDYLSALYLIVKHCVQSSVHRTVVVCIVTGGNDAIAAHDGPQRFFVSHFVTPLIDYLIESLEAHAVIPLLLRRYQRKCQWFQRSRLQRLFHTSQSPSLELERHLYEYLYDQGLSIEVKASTASNQPTKFSLQNRALPLISQALILDNESTDESLTGAVSTLHARLHREGSNAAYLIIFQFKNHVVDFKLEAGPGEFPQLCLGPKRINLVPIRLSQDATKQVDPPLKATLEVDQAWIAERLCERT